MSIAVLRGADDELPPRGAALAGLAVELTLRPWSTDPRLVDKLAEQGFGEDAVEAATTVVAVFNYLTRVADATGIEFDYNTPLPAFEPDHDRQPAVRPDRESWPMISREQRTFTRLPGLSAAWQQWHDYVFESDEPLGHRERQLLARVAAEESCDRWRVADLDGYEPENATDELLVTFGRRLARQPWRMGPGDLDRLREAGLPEAALLHAIAVVALQSAESRLVMGCAIGGA